MKKKFQILLVTMIMVTSFAPHVEAQKGGIFYSSVAAGISASADFKNISAVKNKVAGMLEVGYSPVPNLSLGLRMATRPYSPENKDSLYLKTPADSLNPQGGGYWRNFYNNSSSLLLTIGFVGGGKNGFTGGANFGFGVAFSETNDHLSTDGVVDLTLMLGYNFSSKIGGFISSTYSYVWGNNGKDNFSIPIQIGMTYRFKG